MLQVRSLSSSSSSTQGMVKVSYFLHDFHTSVYWTFYFYYKQPPIKVFGIEGRYATALFSAGTKQNKLEAIEKDLIKFQVLVVFILLIQLHILHTVLTFILQTALKSDSVLKEFVDNPINKRSLKSSTLQLAAKKLALSPPSSNFLSMFNLYILV